MITVINNDLSWDKYQVLFSKAWSELYQDGDDEKCLLKDVDKADALAQRKTTFTDLAHYLSYIKELIAIDPIYLMLPIDETPFAINANTREIEIPKAFKECSGVESDNYAEIVTFTIDRYFDYKDLDQAEIAVQWRNESTKVEGVSFIQLKDLETYGSDNKIRFGWPITSEMTTGAGTLTFAVRFYTCEMIEGKYQFNYLLNTRTASIPIKPTLNIDFNGINTIKKDNDYNVFTSYITNSANPSYGIPTEVKFVLNDEEFPQFGRISLSDNTLQLKAQAMTKDLNPIVYEWYEKSSETPLVSGSNYTISSEYEIYMPTEWPTERPMMTFWIPRAGSTTAYNAFVGAWPQENPGNFYLKKEILTFLDTEADVTGEYFLRGINTNNINTVYQDSRTCIIESPGDIAIKEGKDLAPHMFLDEKTNTLDLEITEIETHLTPEKIYNIYHSTTPFTKNQISGMEPVDSSEVTEALTYSYQIPDNAFGYYLIQPTSTLNRTTKETVSNVCYVSDHPGKPIGTMLINDKNPLTVDSEPDSIPDVGGTLDTNVLFEWEGGINSNVIKINATGDAGQVITLQVAHVIENNNGFNEGDITYTWTRTLEGVTTEITAPGNGESDIKDIDFETGKLTIRALAPETGRYTYDCVITNTIADVDEKSARYSFIII